MDELNRLQPMPEPNYKELRKQIATGLILVTVTSGVCVGGTLGMTYGLARLPSNVSYFFCNFVCLNFVFSYCCLMGLMLSDPGIIHRSPETSLPPPDIVERYLANGHRPSALERNIAPDGQDREYCVRCCVWREQIEQVRWHHCRVCQRCVPHFDHHCELLGRCIAGRGCRGNLLFFYGLIASVVCGIFTSFGITLASLSYQCGRCLVIVFPILALVVCLLVRRPAWDCLRKLAWRCRRFFGCVPQAPQRQELCETWSNS